MQEVKILRLSTGEDVIAKITNNSDAGTVTLKQPFVIIPHQQGPGKPVQLMMTLYSPYGKSDSVELKDQNIISIVEPKDEILKSYEQNTSSIIQAPGLITETKIPQL
ncbi:hypothetical protein N9K83_00530 [bacterium]|nr:hypothetical protein [bacterium]